LEVDNQAVRLSQIQRLEQIKAVRDNEKVAKALEKITEAANTKQGNLLALAVDAARERATLAKYPWH
jgi:methylmalonyl-CoA mutase